MVAQIAAVVIFSCDVCVDHYGKDRAALCNAGVRPVGAGSRVWHLPEV